MYKRQDYNRANRLKHCHLDDRSTKSDMLGVPVLASGGLTRLASPIAHLRPDSPPLLVVHGRKDVTVPWGQSLELYRAAEAAGLRTAFYSVAEGGHDLGMMTAKTRSAEVPATVCRPAPCTPPSRGPRWPRSWTPSCRAEPAAGPAPAWRKPGSTRLPGFTSGGDGGI